MDFNTIDWDALWREESTRYSQRSLSEKEVWDKRAATYDLPPDGIQDYRKLDKEDYVTKILDRIEVQADWTVLDIGSGPGTLAIPLAKRAQSVTALDISPAMLAKLKAKADKEGLRNIQCLNSSMQDAFANQQVKVHDVVVASRSLMIPDLKGTLTKIVAVTGQSAYLTFPVVHLPFDWEIYRVIGREGKKHPPYVYAYNLLYQMGVKANVELLVSRVMVSYQSVEEAIEVLQRRNDPFNQAEMQKLRAYLEKKFVGLNDSEPFTYEGRSKWALIWWRKADQV